MNFIKIPLAYTEDHSFIVRSIDERAAMIDNLIELIVFTPRGSFIADADFGFEYWNYEYSNVHFRDFNSGQNENFVNGLYNEVTRKECQESIKRSLEAYEVQLRQVEVLIELRSIKKDVPVQGKKISSKYEVLVQVTGMLDDGLGISTPYRKEISFLMEPTVKRVI